MNNIFLLSKPHGFKRNNFNTVIGINCEKERVLILFQVLYVNQKMQVNERDNFTAVFYYLLSFVFKLEGIKLLQERSLILFWR